MKKKWLDGVFFCLYTMNKSNHSEMGEREKMNPEPYNTDKDFFKGLLEKTLLMALLFGLLGAHFGLSSALILLHIGGPESEHFIIAKSLYEEMIHPGERGFRALGGLFGRLGEIHDTIVFLPFLILLGLLLLANYFRNKNQEPGARVPLNPPPKINRPLIFFALLILLSSVVIFYQVQEIGMAVSLTTSTTIFFLVTAAFFTMITPDVGEAFRRRPFWAALGLLIAMALFWSITGIFSQDLFGLAKAGASMASPYVAWPVNVFCALILFLLVGEGGIISFLAGKSLEFKSLGLRSFLAAGLLLAAMIPLSLFTHYFYESFLNMAIGGAGEPTRLGFRRLTFGLGIKLGIPLAVVGGAFTAMIPKGVSRRTRVYALTIPLFFILSTWGAGKAFEKYAHKVWDMDKASLKEAASLIKKDPPPSPRIALLLREAQKGKGSRIEFRWQPNFSSSKDVDLIPENLPKLNDYLKATEGSWTSFTYDAMQARYEIASRHWLVEDLRDILMENSLKKGSLLNSMLLLTYLSHSPVTAKNRQILEYLSDGGQFIVKGRACLRMARAWVAMGEPEKAKGFYQCAEKSLAQKQLEGFTLSERPAFIQGRVTGRIEGEVTLRARLSVLYLGGEKDPEGTLTSFVSTRVKAAVDLEEDGSFSFADLPEGRYGLALLLRREVRGPFDVIGGGAFLVNRDHPTVNVGVIQVIESPPG